MQGGRDANVFLSFWLWLPPRGRSTADVDTPLFLVAPGKKSLPEEIPEVIAGGETNRANPH